MAAFFTCRQGCGEASATPSSSRGPRCLPTQVRGGPGPGQPVSPRVWTGPERSGRPQRASPQPGPKPNARRRHSHRRGAGDKAAAEARLASSARGRLMAQNGAGPGRRREGRRRGPAASRTRLAAAAPGPHPAAPVPGAQRAVPRPRAAPRPAAKRPRPPARPGPDAAPLGPAGGRAGWRLRGGECPRPRWRWRRGRRREETDISFELKWSRFRNDHWPKRDTNLQCSPGWLPSPIGCLVGQKMAREQVLNE